MSYLVLARKWRPQTFAEVVGQPHVTRTLQNAISKSRIAHAYLFCGARGVGKTSVARIFAKTLNCLATDSPKPCNECSNCREITQGNAVDVLEIDGASNRGIDSIRDLRETVRYRPAKSHYKIYIIDEVHMLTTEAFNALLKTLEEPPEHVLFLFATTEPHKIPATILSRCQRFDFRRIPTPELIGHLRHIALQEQTGLPDGVLYALAREADGSMRDAQSLLEQVLAFSGDDLTGEEILDILGIVDRESVNRVVAAVLEGNARVCLEVVADLYRRGIDCRRFCQQLCDCFRNLLVLATGGSSLEALLDLPDGEIQLLKEALGKTSAESLHLIFQLVLKAEEEIRRSTLPRTTLEMLLLRLTQLPRLESLEEILARLNLMETRLRSEPSGPMAMPPAAGPPGRQPPRTSPAAPPLSRERVEEEPLSPPLGVAQPPPVPLRPVDPAKTVQEWPRFLSWLETHDGILAAKLDGSQITLASQETIGLEVKEIFEHVINEPQALAKLTEAARTFFGVTLQWVVRTKTAPASPARDSLPSTPGKGSLRRSLMEHPVIVQALEILGAELVDIRPLKQDHQEPSDNGPELP